MSDLQTVEPIGNLVPDIGARGLPPSLQILLNEGLYNRIKQLSGVMSRATGMTPQHLIDKPEACFAIINLSLDWKLSPHFVARHTYQTPNGQIGFDGALVQAVLEQSGRFIGSPKFEYRGNWETLTGKFEIKAGARGGSYPIPTWTAKDAIGLGVIVRWGVRGEQAPRVWPGEDDPFWLTQCYPLNSPLWATDPKTQIQYLTIRRFANLTSPGILGAAAFDQDELLDASDRAVDVTPEPQREDFVRSHRPEPVDDRPEFAVVDNDGVEYTYRDGAKAAEGIAGVLREAARSDLSRLESAWDNNQPTVEQLARDGFPDEAVGLAAQFDAARNELTTSRPAADAGRPEVNAASSAQTGAAAPRGDAAAQPREAPLTRETPAAANDAAKPEPAATAPAPAAPATPEPRPFPGDVPEDRLGLAVQQPADSDDKRPPDLAIAPVIRNGKPDWRTWTVALFLPKVRQTKDSDRLTFLIGDNDANLTEAKRVLSPDDLRMVETTIAAQWKAVETGAQ